MTRKLVIIFFFFRMVSNAQSDYKVTLGVTTGYSVFGYDFRLNNFELQLFLNGYYKKWISELNYGFMPISEFGIKSKPMLLIGRSTNPDNRFNMNGMIGMGYFFGTKYKTYEDSSPYNEFYPNQWSLCTKIGFVYSIKQQSNINFVTNLCIQTERIYLYHRLNPSSLYFDPSLTCGIRLKF